MSNQHQEWEVQKILQRGSINNMTHYLVKWVGYPLEEATWEPLTNLDNCQHAIIQFETSLRSIQTRSRKPRKKKETMEFFKRDRNQTPPDRIQDMKTQSAEGTDQKEELANQTSPRMIELIPTSKPKMTLDDDLQLEITNKPEKDLRSPKKQAKLQSPLPAIQPIKDLSQNTVKSIIAGEQKQAAVVLQLLQVESPLKLFQKKVIQEKLPVPGLLVPVIENGAGGNESQWQLNNCIRQEDETCHKTKKKRKKSKTPKKPKQKSTRNNKDQDFIPLSRENLAYQEVLVKNQHKIDLHSSALQKQQETGGNIPQSKQQQPITEIEVKDVNQFISLLLEERSAQCDEALKAFQRNMILSITRQGIKNDVSIKCPMLDLFHSPEALGKLDSVSIVRDSNTKMQVALLARLPYGWFSIGKVDGTLSIGAVRLIDEESWSSIFKRSSDNL